MSTSQNVNEFLFKMGKKTAIKNKNEKKKYVLRQCEKA